MKNELGDCTRRFNLCLVASSAMLGLSKSKLTDDILLDTREKQTHNADQMTCEPTRVAPRSRYTSNRQHEQRMMSDARVRVLISIQRAEWPSDVQRAEVSPAPQTNQTQEHTAFLPRNSKNIFSPAPFSLKKNPRHQAELQSLGIFFRRGPFFSLASSFSPGFFIELPFGIHS
jgi:hypothetical protein